MSNDPKKTAAEPAIPASASRRGFLASASVAGLGAAALLASTNKQAKAQSGDPIPIGGALPLSGFAAADGIEFRRGLEMAAAEINALGGILGRPIELHLEDTKEMGAELTSQAMQRLIDLNEVHAVINGYNVGTTSIEMDVAAENDIILVHYNTAITAVQKFNSNPELYYGSFMGDPPEYYYGPGFLLFLRSLEEQGLWTPPNRKLALIPSANEYSIIIANAIREQAAEYGFEISLYETVPYPNNQWGPVIAQLKQDPPAAIAITHFLPQDLAGFMKEFVPNPTNSLVYMQYGPSLPAFREIGGEAVNGVIYSTVIGAIPDEFGRPYREKYAELYGADAAFNIGSQTYDGLWHYALAAAIAGGSGEPFNKEQNQKVAGAMLRLVYRGMNGTCRYEVEGQAAYCYPTQIADPSLGMPHQFLQHQDYREQPLLIAPPLYAVAPFKLPPWVS
ncbi:MAG: ABC transporter substrate-binding protein [Rhodospirillales bacterium]